MPGNKQKSKKLKANFLCRVHAEENKRRTLQRSDIATAVSKTDMCDFLIDIVPREEAAKSAPYDQQQQQQQTEYNNYYPPQGTASSVPQYAPQQVKTYTFKKDKLMYVCDRH